MRHRKSGKQLGRNSSHRTSMFRNLSASLFEHELIKTTLPKAKEMRRIIDKLVTLGKRGDLHARRIAVSKIRDEKAVKKLFEVIGPRYKDREGGYARVLKAGFRYGDMAPMAIIELVERDPEAKGRIDRERVAAEEAAAEE